MLAIDYEMTPLQAQSCVHSGTAIAISTNTPWSTTMSPVGDVEILAGATLTITGTVFMKPNAYIRVNKGAVLTVDGGTLTTQCNDVWQGVIVMGDNTLPQQPNPVWAPNPQGTANFRNGALVEHALVGVSNWNRNNHATTGGRVFINKSTFRNNWIGVEFEGYPAFGSGITGPYSSSITNSEFIDDANLKPHPISSSAAVLGVYVESIQGIRILGSKFESLTFTGFPWVGRSGITGWNASLVIAAGCDQPSPGVYPCPPQYITYPEFTNLSNGVSMFYSYDQNGVVDEGIFKDNLNDIYVVGVDNARLTRNSISKPAQGVSGQYGSLTGIFIEYSDGYWIEENYIEGVHGGSTTHKGISADQSGPEENEVYRNTIKNVTSTVTGGGATTALGENRSNASILISGLQFLCNTYIENSTDQYIDYFSNPFGPMEGIRANQGEFAFGIGAVSAGNTFTHTLNYFNDIHNLASPFFYLHHGGNSFPFLISPPNSVTVGLAQTANRCLSGFGEEPGPVGPIDPEMGRLMLSAGDRDSLNQAYSSHISSYQDLQNDFFQLIDGGATNELLDQIENTTDAETANSMKTSLEAISPYLSEKVLKSVAANAYFDLDFTLGLCISNPDATRNTSFLNFMENEAIYPINTDQIEDIRNSWSDITERTEMVQIIAQHNLEASRAVKKLIMDLKLQEGENGSFSEVNSLYASWPGLRYKYTQVEHLFRNHQVNEATSLLNSLPSAHDMDARLMDHHETYTMFYSFRLQVYESGRVWSELSSDEINHLRMIADRSFSKGSQMASGVLCFYYNECEQSDPFEVPEDDAKYIYLEPDQDFIENGISTTAEIIIWPNPSSDWFNISYPDEFEFPLDIDFFNMLGQLIKSESALYSGEKVSLDGLVNGQYILVYKQRGSIVGRESLIKK